MHKPDSPPPWDNYSSAVMDFAFEGNQPANERVKQMHEVTLLIDHMAGRILREERRFPKKFERKVIQALTSPEDLGEVRRIRRIVEASRFILRRTIRLRQEEFNREVVD